MYLHRHEVARVPCNMSIENNDLFQCVLPTELTCVLQKQYFINK